MARFRPIGNMGCRTWWGSGGHLLDHTGGGYSGEWLFGVNGPGAGRYESGFAEWCARHRLLCVRTVDLFWVFEYHRRGFPRHLDLPRLRRRWQEEKCARRRFALALTEPGWKPPEGGTWWVRLPQIPPKRIPWSRLSPEAREFLKRWHPDPGPWERFHRRHKEYFSGELARYRRVRKFWTLCGDEARRAFLRCARFSNRRPESHPDFFVACPAAIRRGSDFGFVEVKGPRESVRPSQKRFFPELIGRARQRVWLARFKMHGDGISFGRFEGTGRLVAFDTLFGNPRTSSDCSGKPSDAQRRREDQPGYGARGKLGI